jgi:hypothetical protein
LQKRALSPHLLSEAKAPLSLLQIILFASLKAQNEMKPLPLSLFYFKTILLRLQAAADHGKVSALLLGMARRAIGMTFFRFPLLLPAAEASRLCVFFNANLIRSHLKHTFMSGLHALMWRRIRGKIN